MGQIPEGEKEPEPTYASGQLPKTPSYPNLGVVIIIITCSLNGWFGLTSSTGFSKIGAVYCDRHGSGGPSGGDDFLFFFRLLTQKEPVLRDSFPLVGIKSKAVTPISLETERTEAGGGLKRGRTRRDANETSTRGTRRYKRPKERERERERERNKRDSRDRVAIRLSGVRVKCRWTEAITICQSEYKKG